jgi:hypothetical protein
MRRLRGPLLFTAVIGLGALGSPSLSGCTDSTTGLDSLCDRITLTANGFLIATRCGAGTVGGNSNFVRDDQDRLISFDFDVSCTDGSDRVVGSVSGIDYDAQNRIVGYDAIVNGQTCTYP